MQIITNTNLAQEIIARYTGFLAIAATDANIVFLQPPISGKQAGSTVFNEQSVQHIYNCIEQNTLVNVNVNLQFLSNMLGRAVQQINAEEWRAEAMTAHAIAQKTMQKERIIIKDTKVTPTAKSLWKTIYEQAYNNAANSMQTLSNTVLHNTMAQLVNNTTKHAYIEHLSTSAQSVNITQNAPQTNMQKNIVKGTQNIHIAQNIQNVNTTQSIQNVQSTQTAQITHNITEIATNSDKTKPKSIGESTLAAQLQASKLPTLQPQGIQPNSSGQEDKAAVYTQAAQLQHIDLVNKENMPSEKIGNKAISTAQQTNINFETTVQKAVQALSTINKTQKLTRQADMTSDARQSLSGVNADTKAAQPIKSIMQKREEINLPISGEAQKMIMRKAQDNTQPNSSQMAQSEAGLTAKSIDTQQSADTISKPFTAAALLHNTQQKNQKANEIKLHNIAQSPPQREVGEAKPPHSMTQSPPQHETGEAKPHSITQSPLQHETSEIKGHDTATQPIQPMQLMQLIQPMQLMQQESGSSALPPAHSVKQSKPFSVTANGMPQLVYSMPMANIKEPLIGKLASATLPLGVQANSAKQVQKYLQIGRNKMIAQNTTAAHENIMQSLMHRALTGQVDGRSQAMAQALGAQPILAQHYSAPENTLPQAQQRLPSGLAKVNRRSEAPITRVLRQEPINAPTTNKAQDESMDIPTVHTKRSETKKTINNSEKQEIYINGSQTAQSVRREDVNAELAEAEVMRITDKVYKAIESRLHSEKMRRGKW